MPRVNRQPVARDAEQELLAAPSWSPLWRRLATLAIVLHLTGVFVAPWAFQMRSALNDGLAQFYRPYLDAAYLNHGYAFFAPDPGPSHLIRYEVTRANGDTVTGVFPNPAEHRPRLLYHRHFMLTEFVANCPPELGQEYVRSYAKHLLAKHDGDQAVLTMRRHLLPGPEDVLNGMRLDDPQLYQERPLGRFLADGTAEYPPPPVLEPLGPLGMEPPGPIEAIPAAGMIPGGAGGPLQRPLSTTESPIRLPEVR